jgi:hypothetical protein
VAAGFDRSFPSRFLDINFHDQSQCNHNGNIAIVYLFSAGLSGARPRQITG